MVSKISGIYCIEVTSGNLEKIGWKYIGQSKNCVKRMAEHRNKLVQNRHENKRLQSYFNKYGESSLYFYVFFECEEKLLNFWEKFYIDSFNCLKSGFNTLVGGENQPRRYKKCKLQNILTGEIIEKDSILEFAECYDLNKSTISLLLAGKRNFVGDWFCPENKWRPKLYTVIDPKGKSHTFFRLTEFGNKHGFEQSHLWALVSGKIESAKGWYRPDSDRSRRTYNARKFCFKSPDGRVYQGKNIAKFAREHDLYAEGLFNILSGRYSQHKGWTIYNQN